MHSSTTPYMSTARTILFVEQEELRRRESELQDNKVTMLDLQASREMVRPAQPILLEQSFSSNKQQRFGMLKNNMTFQQHDMLWGQQSPLHPALESAQRKNIWCCTPQGTTRQHAQFAYQRYGDAQLQLKQRSRRLLTNSELGHAERNTGAIQRQITNSSLLFIVLFLLLFVLVIRNVNVSDQSTQRRQVHGLHNETKLSGMEPDR